MNHIFHILLNVANGESWSKAFQSVLPARFINPKANKQEIKMKPKYLKTEFMARSESY